ncbi:interferon-induced protein 44-like [Periophthalmus magnuspinnatus]|uniref:interferon-induced protein 44-like n=1 Tax=Periophthalmus magnuspinnatus TaxID=409849 RepID=UPI00243694D3|nr:interferon-induced protein 44-like [Periophthalmus magnuspinnatus]
MKTPWRTFSERENQNDLLSLIKNFRPSKDEVKRLHILLYGPVGGGKSTFINSVNTVLRGTSAIPASACASDNECKSFTLEYKNHSIRRERSKEFFPFVFTDIMGMEPDKNGIHVEDLILMLKGHVRDGYKFNPCSPLTDTSSQFYNPNPAPEDKVHLLVCVLPAHRPDIHEEHIPDIKRMRNATRDLQIPHVVLLTHIDVLCKKVEENVMNVFKVKAVLDKIKDYGGKLGFDENNFFPVRNYCRGYLQQNENLDKLILITLQHMLNYADDFTHTL